MTNPPPAEVDDPILDLFVNGSDGVDQRLQTRGLTRQAA
jgi:hypothetical protein